MGPQVIIFSRYQLKYQVSSATIIIWAPLAEISDKNIELWFRNWTRAEQGIYYLEIIIIKAQNFNF